MAGLLSCMSVFGSLANSCSRFVQPSRRLDGLVCVELFTWSCCVMCVCPHRVGVLLAVPATWQLVPRMSAPSSWSSMSACAPTSVDFECLGRAMCTECKAPCAGGHPYPYPDPDPSLLKCSFSRHAVCCCASVHAVRLCLGARGVCVGACCS